MGAAYFIVLSKKKPKIDTFVNGKAVARNRDAIYAITESLGLRGIDDLASFGDLDDEFDVPAEYRETETPWFSAEEGVDWITAIRQSIEANPKSVKEAEALIADLEEYEAVFRRAAKIGAKWHFEMDI